MVVGVDFSEGSAAAVAEAKVLAERLGLEPIYAHVVEDGGEAPAPAEVGRWLRAHGVERSAVQVLQGVAWIELGRYAKASASRLLVVGSHGRSGFQPLWPGRTAMRLAVRSPIPVVVVPAARRSSAGGMPGNGYRERAPEGFRRLDGAVRTTGENRQ